MAHDPESGDDLVEGDENLTQERMGEGESRPVDVSWEKESWGDAEDSPREGEAGQEDAVA